MSVDLSNGSLQNLSRLELSMMTIEQLEDYMMGLFSRQDEFGAAYVTRQVEWAENEIQKKLTAEKLSLMAKTGESANADLQTVLAMAAK